MKYEQWMLDEVKRYISDDTYDYALMIDGEWGSGKTYFVKEVLGRELNAIKKDGVENRVRYYSVCGTESLSEFKETMIYDLLEKKADQLHEFVTREFEDRRKAALEELDEAGTCDKNSPVERVLESKKRMVEDIIEEQREARKQRIASFKRTRAFKIGMDISSKMIIGLLKSRVPLLGAVDAGDYLADVEDLREYVFVFDDIERCAFSVHALLCFINEMVEHVHAKVILVMNEQAFLQKQKGLPAKSEYTDYIGIREKLVGTVIRYKNDNAEVFEQLIRKNLADGSLFFKSALRHVPKFCAMVKETHHHSLRTFQFFLSRLKNVEQKLKEELCEETATVPAAGAVFADCLSEEMTDRLLSELFAICMDVRERVSEQNGPAENKEYAFPSLAYYIERGILDIERLRKEIDEKMQP